MCHLILPAASIHLHYSTTLSVALPPPLSFIPQTTMAYKRKTLLMPYVAPVPEPNAGETAMTKLFPPLDVRSDVLDLSVLVPTSTIYLPLDVPRKTNTPVATNTSIDPTGEFKPIVNNIIDAINFLTDPISYEIETVLLHMVKLRQELKVVASTYKSDVTHLNKYLLHVITSPI